jgi:hypothetical protein
MSVTPTLSPIRQKINWAQARTLVGVYLKQDLRSGRAAMRPDKGEYVRSNWSLAVMILSYTVLGAMVSLMAFTGIDVLFYSIIALSCTFLIVALAIVVESGNVIFNESEADVLGHMPVNSRTLFVAKVINLFSFTLLLAIPANLIPTLTGVAAARSNILFIPAHLLSATAIAFFASALIVTTYGALMRYVSREKFDSIITYCQVALGLIFILGYQVAPRLFEKFNLGENIRLQWYHLLYPPTWFSGLALVVMGRVDALSASLSALAAISVLAIGAVALRKVAAGYSSMVSRVSADKSKVKAGGEEVGRSGEAGGIWTTIKSAVLRRPVERAVFDLVLVYLKRNREIRVRLYTSLVYFIVFPIIALLDDGLPDPFLAAGENQFSIMYSLMGPAFVCFGAQTAIEGLVFSEHYRASYIFRIAPIAKLGEIHGGLRKAALLLIDMPEFLVLFMLYGILWQSPWHAFLIILPWMAVAPTMLMLPFTFREIIPLSVKYQKGRQTSRNSLIIISALASLMVLGGAQAAAIRGVIPYWILVGVTVALSVAFYILFRFMSRESRPLPPVTEN